MSFVRELFGTTAVDRGAYAASSYVQRCMAGGFTREDYLDFLNQFYFIVREFCPIMAVAAARMPSHDPYFELKYALYHRVDEEKGHQQLVLDDIAAIGGDVAKVAAGLPSLATHAMIGYNYNSADRENPCSVFAMLFVLETLMSELGPRVGAILAKGLGVTPASGLKFFASHAELDQDHAAELMALMEKIGNGEDRTAVVRATRVNYYLLSRIMT